MEENWIILFYAIWRDAMQNYQKAVKGARACFYSNKFLSNHSNPGDLFKVLDSVTAPCLGPFINASQEKCEIFQFFYNKLNDLKQQIAPQPGRTSLYIISNLKLILLSF